MLFKGSGVALITPFNQDGSIDYASLRTLIEFQIEKQTDAIIINGTTGESATLSVEEQSELIDFTIRQVDGRIPVIAGTGSNDTQTMVKLSQKAEQLGADGLLIVTPYYNKTSQAGIYQHYKLVHEQTSIPIILYNVPSRTQVNIEPKTVQKLSKLKRIVGLKDATGDFSYTLQVRALCGSDFALYSGNDDMIIPMMSLGGVGVISVLANVVPFETQQMTQAFLDGDLETAEVLQVKYAQLIQQLFIEPNPIPVKYVLHEMGYCEDIVRLPLVSIGEDKKVVIKQVLKELNLA